MLNINGLGKPNGPGAGKATARNTQTKTEKPGKKERTDSAQFTGVKKQTYGYGAMKVARAGQKTDGLSRKAQDYLEKLKKKYGNMDFIISDYSSGEEADKLLAKGKGEYNVLISPDLLEKMANDENEASKYEAIIEESAEQIKSVKTGLGDDADMVQSYGVTVDADGKATLMAKLIDGLSDKDGNGTVRGNTVDELLSRLNETKASEAKAKEEKTTLDTDDLDKEIKALNEKKDQILNGLRGAEGDRKKELMKQLQAVESELAHKDNPNYRKTHAKIV